MILVWLLRRVVAFQLRFPEGEGRWGARGFGHGLACFFFFFFSQVATSWDSLLLMAWSGLAKPGGHSRRTVPAPPATCFDARNGGWRRVLLTS